MIKVILADDHELVRDGLKLLLESEQDMLVIDEDLRHSAASARSCNHFWSELRLCVDFNFVKHNTFVAEQSLCAHTIRTIFFGVNSDAGTAHGPAPVIFLPQVNWLQPIYPYHHAVPLPC